MKWQSWLFCGTGIIFCLLGIYIFLRNVYEENKSLRPAIYLMIAGIILVGLGTAKFLHLIK